MSEKIDKKYELNTNIIFLFIIIAVPLLLLNYSNILSKNFIPTPVCLFLILTIGVSHGALDNIKGNKVLKYYETTGYIDLTPISLPGFLPNLQPLQHVDEYYRCQSCLQLWATVELTTQITEMGTFPRFFTSSCRQVQASKRSFI